MSNDFLSSVRAEALRRMEAERFEAAVAAERQRIREQEIEFARWNAFQDKLYYTFHEERKVKLMEARKEGRISKKQAEIETAVSDFALQNINTEELYTIVERIDWGYTFKYMDVNGLRVWDYLERPNRAKGDFPLKFQSYCVLALGRGQESAEERISKFNKASLAAVN